MLLGRLRRKAIRTAMVLPLLFVLAVRAAIPAGFMLAPDADGQLVLVLCPDVGPMLPMGEGDAAAHHHHHHPGAPSGDAGNHGRSGSSHEASSRCPFAASAGAAPLPALPAISGADSRRGCIAASQTASATASTILRVQTARGPPEAV